jgi:hypothetical protein
MLSFRDDEVQRKEPEAGNVDRIITEELRESITEFKAFLETGVRRRRSVPNHGDVDCIEIDGDHAVEHLQTLRSRLKASTERACGVSALAPTADLLATAGRFWLLTAETALNYGVPHVRSGSSGKLRPIAECIRAESVEILDKALARLQLVDPGTAAAVAAQDIDDRKGQPATDAKPPTGQPSEEGANIPKRVQTAYKQYSQAVEASNLTDPTDRKVYDLVASSHESSGELEEVPTFDTWSRNLREYRKLTNTQKHQPRAGRAQPRSSTARADQLAASELPTRIRPKSSDK